MRSKIGRAARVCACALGFASPLAAATISVPAGGNLSQALVNAQPGDTIELARGATFVGNFTLGVKGGGGGAITIRTTGDSGLPGWGGRVSPGDSGQLAILRSGNSSPAIQTSPGAHDWTLMLLEVQANANGAGDIITFGDGSYAQSSLSQVPHDLLVDRCYIHGDPSAGQKRGISLNSASTTITGSYISDIKAVGQDNQAIAGWNGPGPYTVTNNYLEAAGENIMFGGADPAIANLVPSDITIANNYISKPTAWRMQSWQVKNLVELKNAQRVTISNNTIEYNWAAAQPGYAVLFTVRNQSGGCPWCVVQHVQFVNNVLRHSAMGINILGTDNDHPSQQTNDIVIRNNLLWDIDQVNWGGNGYALLMSGGPRNVTVDHNTIIQEHASGVIQLDGPQILQFTYTNNLARQNSYGIIGTDHAPGNDSISAYLPGSLITDNVIADAAPGKYPAANLFPTSDQFRAQFVSYAGNDYGLASASAWRGAGTDGGDLGANLSTVGGGGSGSSGGGNAPGAPAGPPPKQGLPVIQMATLAIVTSGLPMAYAGAPYSAQIAAVGGQPPYKWSVASGTLPAGMQLDAQTGVLSGTPQVVVSGRGARIAPQPLPTVAASVTIRVTDSGFPANSVTQTVRFVIDGRANHRPAVATSARSS